MIDPHATGRKLGGYKCAALRCGIPVAEWIDRQMRGQSRCYRCGGWKPHVEFSKDASRVNGRSSLCKPCNSDASTASRYGISLDELKRMRAGGCGICRQFPEYLVVDHCHATGKVRGVLCQRCNAGIGLFGENIDVMQKAMKYLEEHNGRSYQYRMV